MITETLIDRATRLTTENRHTEALLVLAEATGQRRWMLLAKGLIEQHELVGYVTPAISADREALAKQCWEFLERYHTPSKVARFRRAF